MRRLFLLPSFCVLVSCQQYENKNKPDPVGIIFSTSWENGIDPRIQREAINGQSVKVVSLNQTGMSRALEVTIERAENYSQIDSGTPRAELSFAEIARFVRGGDYVINWQTYIPHDYVIDKKQPEVISQIHQGLPSGYPTFALFITNAGKYGVRTRAGEARDSQGGQFGDVERDKGLLVNWKLHYIPDDTGTLALTELQKNGVDVFKVSGIPNAYPSDDDAYFKIGLYKAAWQKQPSDVDQRRMLYGRVSIARVR